MSWVLIYIATKFLAPIPLISLGIDNFLFQFPPNSTNISSRISQKSPSRKKPASDRLKPDPDRLKPVCSIVRLRYRSRCLASHCAARTPARLLPRPSLAPACAHPPSPRAPGSLLHSHLTPDLFLASPNQPPRSSSPRLASSSTPPPAQLTRTDSCRIHPTWPQRHWTPLTRLQLQLASRPWLRLAHRPRSAGRPTSFSLNISATKTGNSRSGTG
jgi:hypothetical protein